MPIRITRPGKDVQLTIDGTVFTVRRIPVEEDTRLRKQHTKRGDLDALSYAIAKLELCVVGWSSIDVDGEPTAFDRALIPYLPDSVQAQLLEAISEGLDPFMRGSTLTSPPSGGTPSGAGPTPG